MPETTTTSEDGGTMIHRRTLDVGAALKACSLARTALDDPGGLPEGEPDLERGGLDGLAARADYAIGRLDDAIRALADDENGDPLPPFGCYPVMIHDAGTIILTTLESEHEADRIARAHPSSDMAEVTFEPIYRTAEEANDDLNLGLDLSEPEPDHDA